MRTWKRMAVEMGASLWGVSGGHAEYRMGLCAGPRPALLLWTWQKLGTCEGGNLVIDPPPSEPPELPDDSVLDGDETDDGWDANRRPLSPGQFGTVHIFPSIFRSTFFFLTRAQLDPSHSIMDLSISCLLHEGPGGGVADRRSRNKRRGCLGQCGLGLLLLQLASRSHMMAFAGCQPIKWCQPRIQTEIWRECNL